MMHVSKCFVGVVGLNRYMERQQSTLSWKSAKKEKEKVQGKKKIVKEMSTSDDDDIPVIHQVRFICIEIRHSLKGCAFQ